MKSVAKKMKKAFTITELMVAIALMAAVMAGTGYVFKVAVDAQRTANATAEIMRNLRGITDQMDRDFRGYYADMPVATGTDRPTFTINGTNVTVKADRIKFVANGDFQSVKQYNGKTISGNLASVCYGQSGDPDPYATSDDGRAAKILTRRQSIFTSDTSVPIPVPDPCEYITEPFAKWRLDTINAYATARAAGTEQAWLNLYMQRPLSNPASDPNNLPLYMARGVDDFTVEVLGSGNMIDPNGSLNWVDPNNTNGKVVGIKFTFTLYAHAKSGKAFKLPNGKPLKMPFTHIVYLKQ